jgi:hypothetical protein
VEATAAVAVLAIAAVAIIMPFTTGAAHEREQTCRTLAASLASELTERILALPFEDPDQASSPGPETGETSEDLYDNIDDYHGYAQPIEPLRAPDGTVLDDPAAAGMTRTAACEYVYVSGQDTGQPPTFIRVTVEVRRRGDPMVSFSRLVYKQ